MMKSLLSIILLAVFFSGIISPYSQAKNYTFDASQLDGNVSNADLALFNQGGQLPGTYFVEILVNDEHVDARDVVFHRRQSPQGEPYLEPCLTTEQLSRYGIKVENYPRLAGAGPGECAVLSAIPQAYSELRFSSQQLLLSIPQVAIRSQVRGIAPQELWDDGIPAFLMNYRLSHTRTENRGQFSHRNDSQFVQLEPGMNLGPWRLRSSYTWEKSGHGSGQWQTLYTYAERGINHLKSRLTLGDRFTSSDVFDGVPFRGMMLASDDDMVPASMRSFSPVVRGIARTQARVEIKQNGYTIYNATVPPGPFALSDLSTTASGGDLEVTVRETDGESQFFSVPYQTPAIALHEGYLRYSLMAGQFRPSDASKQTPEIAQATVIYGLPWDLTAYSGLQVAENYQAVSYGLGASLGNWGSLSVDSTHSRGKRQNGRTEEGYAWRLRYSKLVNATNTSLALSSYQYASSGYNTLSDVLNSYLKGDISHNTGGYGYSSDRRKSRSTLTLNQSLGTWGYMNLYGSRENYWDHRKYQDSFGGGYGITIKGISLSLNWTQKRSHNGDRKNNERLLGLMASMPLNSWAGSNIRANYQATSSSSGRDSQQLGLSGQGFDRQLSWNVSQHYYPGAASGDSNNSAAQLGWTGGAGQINGNYSYSPSTRQTGVDVSGGVLATSDGMTFVQRLDENNGVALVAAQGASGVPVGGWPGVKTDFRGYTALSSLSPYQMNMVSLDASRLPVDAEVAQTDINVVPTKGAVTRARFVTHIGGRALVTLTRSGGKAVPFGAVSALDGNDTGVTGVVGYGGQLYMAGLPDKGTLTTRWGPAREEQCQADFRLPEARAAAGLYMINAVCR